MPRVFRGLAALLLAAGAAVGGACSDPNELADATIPNRVDTVTIGALTGTPVTTPSAFSINAGAVRTDQESAFDFAYNVDAGGRPVFLTLRVLGLIGDASLEPGFIRTGRAFDAIREAERNGYVTDDTVHVAAGERYYIRSRAVCTGLGVPQYGKMEILSIDAAARTITFRVLVNNNCGYVGLEPGIPEN